MLCGGLCYLMGTNLYLGDDDLEALAKENA